MLGPDVQTSHTALFSLPVVPMILGFDPRYQFVHEDDVVERAGARVRNDLPGAFNVAADGVLAFSEVGRPAWASRTRRSCRPGARASRSASLRRAGLRIPPEMLSQLRFGRGLDNRKLKATGFGYRYTSREAVVKLAEHLRLAADPRGAQEPYRYERGVEDFLRWSPHVRSARGKDDGADTPPVAPVQQEPPVEHYDDLEAEEIISLLGSLEALDLEALRDYERETRAREAVVAAIEGVLARRAMRSRP